MALTQEQLTLAFKDALTGATGGSDGKTLFGLLDEVKTAIAGIQVSGTGAASNVTPGTGGTGGTGDGGGTPEDPNEQKNALKDLEEEAKKLEDKLKKKVEEQKQRKIFDDYDLASNSNTEYVIDALLDIITKKMGIKNFSLSFTNSRSDVLKLREIVGDANIISKIETLKALGNIEEIVEEANEILIDRGDLSRQVPVQKIPLIQSRLVSFCRSREVAVYVATNLLETMVLSKNPTRAEVNDVISTLIMGANGLVLAGETAIGSYPAEVAAMASTLINEFRRWTPHSTFDEILYDKDT